ncbi:hypothetical protein ACQJBY_037089 [Aegilops geniculata]
MVCALPQGRSPPSRAITLAASSSRPSSIATSWCYWGVFFHGWKQDVPDVGAHREGYYDSLLTSEGALEDRGCPDSLASERW